MSCKEILWIFSKKESMPWLAHVSYDCVYVWSYENYVRNESAKAQHFNKIFLCVC